MLDSGTAVSSEETPAASAAGLAPEPCDVLVIGGGPAGSTCAALLAERGIEVVLLEKAHHPRFHIGESLLPANLPLLAKLGVADAVAAIGMKKEGVEFSSPWHEGNMLVEFSEAWDKSMPFAWQVRRSEFDHILINNAKAKGADVVEGCGVQGVEFDPEGVAPAIVTAQCDDGDRRQYAARFVVDASGRDTFLANRFKTKEKNRKHNSSALFGHFKNVERLPGRLEGNISIFWFEHGWFWLIPLSGGATSIGAVCWPHYLKSRKTDVKQFFMDTIALCPQLAERMKDARLASPVSATGNYAYGSSVSHGKQYLLLGDAYAFVDPVFSSGVFLAMSSAFESIDAIEVCLRQPARANAALGHFDRMMRRGPREFSWFIYRMTNPTMRDLFMAPSNVLRVKEGLLSVLAGDIFNNRAIWPSVYVFKAIYYLASLANFKRTRAAIKQRAVNIKDPSPREALP